ncbi:ComEC/Rec2 family competence protein [Cohnella terricola]|uniref:MBL fold metallo-hydrolase n=1 Tax=Cohnella terricola TaxID=1289167 RepID=A0A559J9Y0_9BACL|nr:MBL fold metallo-hydrolase [Cohnella terricola]TVX96698.1 MBL fold metallo-hydrolase [Cohnella terricola]
MMRAKVHFLNVGWGDAHLIRLPSGTVTLIDGGDGSFAPDRDHPLSWMDRQGLRRLDWMILTHIHADHLNGLIDIAIRCEVKRAILPYELPQLNFSTEETEDSSTGSDAGRVSRMLTAYEELIRLLRKQGTDIRWRSDYASAGSSVIWEEEGYTLTHLYPWQGDPLPGLDVLREAVSEDGRTGSERFASLERFFTLSNDDSSVYRLTSAEARSDGVLFGGDQLEAGWERLSRRTDLRSRVWKVPHHGMEDAFTFRLLSAIEPEFCVIPISRQRAWPLEEHWDRLRERSRAVFHLTGDFLPGKSVRLADGPIEVEIGE